MVEIIFILKTIPSSIQTNINEKFYNIFRTFAFNTGKNINDLTFMYSGRTVDPQKTFNEVANNFDKMEGKMTILVYLNREFFSNNSGMINNNNYFGVINNNNYSGMINNNNYSGININNNYSGINNNNNSGINNNIIFSSNNNITLEGLFSIISQMKNEFNVLINQSTNEINVLKNVIIYLKNELKNIMNVKKNNSPMNIELEFDKNKNSEIKEYIDTLFKRHNERTAKLLKQTKVNHADNAIRLQNSTVGVKPNSIVKVENNGKIFSDIIFTKGMIMAWYGKIDLIPSGWVICDGNNGSPDLTNKFILGTDKQIYFGNTGGQSSIRLSKNNLPPIGTANICADSHNGRTHHQSNGFIKFQGHYSVAVKGGHPDDWGSNWLIDLNEGMNSSPINIMNPYFTLFYIMKL